MAANKDENFHSMNSAERDAMRRHSYELTTVQTHGRDPRTSILHGTGDAVCIVNCPKTDGRDCNNFEGYRFSEQYVVRMPHERLLNTGSPRIAAMMEPKRQTRMRHRYPELAALEGVEYVLDFTPPEDEEAAGLMTALWLPEGTKIWWTAGYYVADHSVTLGPFSCLRSMADKPVGAVLVLGHDDNCKCHQFNNRLEDVWPTHLIKVPGIYGGDHVPWYREIESYCRIRHCMCVVRILRAIAGEELLINSATRMWTVAQLAIHLDVTEVVRDTIAGWLSASPNTKYIEMFPEEAFQLALGLQLSDVLIASFKILVNERAVELAAPTRSPDKPKKTWAGRVRRELDLSLDAIEHAGQAMADRLNATFEQVKSVTGLDISEWNKLLDLGPILAQKAERVVQGPEVDLLGKYNSLVAAIKSAVMDMVRLTLYDDLIQLGGPGERIRAQRAHVASEDQLLTLSNQYATLHHPQRVCLPFIWTWLMDNSTTLARFKSHWHEGVSVGGHAHLLNRAIEYAVETRLLPARTSIFDLEKFHTDLHDKIQMTCCKILGLSALGGPGGWDPNAQSTDIDLFISDHLITTLEWATELKFLPIWAGGNDDGTGGVFQQELPPAVLGATQAGPLYHTRHTDASDTDGRTAGYTTNTDASFSDLGFELEMNGDDTTVAAASCEARGSTGDGQESEMTMACSESIPSEEFTEKDSVTYSEAMCEEPAGHQSLGRALAAYVMDESDGAGDGPDEQDEQTEEWEVESDQDTDSTVDMDDYIVDLGVDGDGHVQI